MSDLTPYLDKIRSLLSLSTVVGRYVKLKRHGHEYQACCPFHNEKTPSFTLNDQKGFYHCFGCGSHGDLITFLMEFQKIPFMEAVKQLANEVGIDLPKTSHESVQKEKELEGLYRVLDIVSSFFEEKLLKSELCKEYLKKRHISTETSKKYRLGFAPSVFIPDLLKLGVKVEDLIRTGIALRKEDKSLYPRFRDRLMIPIRDAKARVIGFGGRALLADQQPKYLNSPETEVFHKGSTLFGLDTLKNVSKDHPLIVVEGYFDAIQCQINGFQAVAPLGTALTHDQIKLLWRHTHLPILCFDGDFAGEKAKIRAAYNALSLLKPGFSLNFMSLPLGEDPDSFLKAYPKESFQTLISQPKTLFDVLVNDYIKNLYNKSPEQKAKIKKTFLEQLESIPDKDVKAFYKNDFYEKSYQKKNDVQLKKDVDQKSILEDPEVSFQKIFLVTLINHPTLLSVTLEQMAQIDFNQDEFKQLQNALMKYALEGEKESHWTEIEETFAQTISILRHQSVYSKAPFAMPKVDVMVAEEGWFDLWRRYERKKLSEQEVSYYKNIQEGELSTTDWNALKQLYKDLDNY